MKKYEILRILDRETRIPKTEGKYSNWVGKIIDGDNLEKRIRIGEQLCLFYTDSEDSLSFGIRTSTVRDWDYVFDDTIRIETRNSIYYLKELSL